MKKIYILSLAVLISAFANAQGISNNDFETWGPNPGFVTTPTGWQTNAASIFPKLMQQSSDAHGGSYAVKLAFETFNSSKLSGTLMGYFHYPTSSPISLQVWAKVFLAGNDGYIINGQTFLNKSIALLGSTTLTVSDNSSVWKLVTVPINIGGGSSSDSLNIQFGLSGNDTTGYVIFDDLTISNGSNSVERLSSNIIAENVYPNPAYDMGNLIYSVREYSSVVLEVFDVMGRKVQSVLNLVQAPGTYRAEIPVSNLAPDIYFASLTANGETVRQKFEVLH